ncbi:MAG: hypothetical protein P1P87_13585, partial [Trueperaceae bacterium]|nr:hypothetical protein [Trueperaceae bacterium]
MIRPLASDELVWFLARAFDFIGHRDPWGLARRAVANLRDPRRDAARSWVFGVGDEPTAGVVAWPPDAERDAPTLRLAQPWFVGADPAAFRPLVERVLERHPHEAVELDLAAVPAEAAAAIGAALAPLGFERDVLHPLAFDLAEVPPLGRPLVLEAWRLEADGTFRAFVAAAEGGAIGEGRWAWLKRAHGRFTPDLWCLAYETLDREPVGYALAGRRRAGVDGELALTAVGVAAAHRGSTEMLRRLVLSVLHE